MKSKKEEVKKPEKIEKEAKFYLFDAKGRILGRLATEIANILNGKDSVLYDPAKDPGNWVVVVNSDKIRLSGEKSQKKLYWRFSGYPGGIYKKTFSEMMELDSTKVIEKAVKGMLPKNKLSSRKLRRLRVFKNEKHPYDDKIKQRK
ncbi:MAG: 50S ribosomal protein L13 [Candidatus Moranbacteria bacterium]|jgi:large subunit ribosomal protein L13|nr:50S ribosomal protein L13 [Candidatus Moranbacteria bacterium]